MNACVRATLLSAGLLLGTLASAPAASAQAASAQGIPARDAEQAFEEGARAAEEARWADSEVAFRRAHELTGALSALFNVGVALRALGRHVEARDVFRRVLATPGVTPPMAERAAAFAAESAERVGELVLEGLAPGIRHDIRIDGAPRDDLGVRPLALEADGGAHALSVSRNGFLPFDWRGEVRATERVRVDVVLTPLPSGSGEIVREWWFWTILGVVVAGAAGITAFVAYDEAQLRTPTPARFDL